MYKITAIEVQKHNPQRVNIYLNGDFAFGLTRIVAGWLHTGQTISDEKIAQLKTEDSREMAYVRALNFLSYRARSEAEIRQNLRKHDVPEEVIDETLERLRQNGFANDEQFARAWVENRNTFRPRSKRALAVELRQKGLTDQVIHTVLEQNVDDETLAYQAGQPKARKLEALEWQDFRKKLSGFLARRGFAYSVIAPTVSKLWGELHTAGSNKHLYDDEEIL